MQFVFIIYNAVQYTYKFKKVDLTICFFYYHYNKKESPKLMTSSGNPCLGPELE